MPRATSDRHAQLVLTWQIWHFRMRQDWRENHRATMKAVVYICRYGNQSRNEVMHWTLNEIAETMSLITEFIEAEAPKSGMGSSPGGTAGSW